jgi:hypothetical protein
VEAWGCELLFLPPYSPIEKAFSKGQGAAARGEGPHVGGVGGGDRTSALDRR